MVRRPAVGAGVEFSVVAAFSDAVEAEVGPVVLVARVQKPAQLLTQTPESEAQRPSILELSLLRQQQKTESGNAIGNGRLAHRYRQRWSLLGRIIQHSKI